MPSVLITGARAPSCLEWIRAFGASGWTVLAADSLRWPLGRFSRHVQSYIQLPAPATDLAAWSMALADAIDRHRPDIVLPTCEEAFYLAHQRARLPQHCRILVSDFALMQQVHHKGEFARLVAGWPCSAPETHELHHAGQLPAFAADSGNWVFKPAFSRFATATLLRPSADQVLTLRPTVAQPWIAQRFAAGTEYCSFSLLHDGKLLAHACYHPRYRVGNGAGIYLQAAQPPGVRAFVERFAAETAFCGQVGFDFIASTDGRLQVLECNPRATSGVHLFHRQRTELVEALIGSGRPALLPQAAPERMVALAMLLFGGTRYGKPGRGFWRDWCRAGDVIHAADDRAPTLLQLAGLGELAARAVRHGLPLLAASTADIEWNGQLLPDDAGAPP